MQQQTFSPQLISPCGMNCGVCMAHLREKNKCPGCRIKDESKAKTRKSCKIKNCMVFKKDGKEKKEFCFSCSDFPCDKINHLDKRYREKYGMSMIENLKEIKNKGMKNFIKSQEKKYVCKSGIRCVHNGKIY